MALLVVIKAVMSARESSLFAALRLSSLTKSQSLVVVIAAALFVLRTSSAPSFIFLFGASPNQQATQLSVLPAACRTTTPPYDQATILLLCCLFVFSF